MKEHDHLRKWVLPASSAYKDILFIILRALLVIISLLQVGSVEMSGSSSTLIKRCPSRILLCSLLPTAMLLLSLLQVINGIPNNNNDNLCGLLPLSYWRSFIESSKAKYQMEKNKQICFPRFQQKMIGWRLHGVVNSSSSELELHT